MKMPKDHKDNNHLIVLIDNNSDFSSFKSSLNERTILITFDYQSHKNLENLSYKHIVSDTFLETSQKNILQNHLYRFSKWYTAPQFKDRLYFENVNLGSLPYIEFFVFLIPFLKKFVEIKKIFQNNPDSTFLASGLLSNMIKQFTTNVKTSKSIHDEKNFLYDEVNFETNSFKIKLSKKNFSRLRNVFEKTISIFLPNNPNSENSVFLVEFNTILYEKLFHQISNSNFSPVYLGTRRPAIWNKSSYSIIKNSKTQVASFSNIPDELKKIIDDEYSKFDQNWLSLLECEDIFENFFTYDNVSFWNVLKPYFIKLFNARIKEAISIIEITKQHFTNFQPKSVLLLSESGFTEQIVSSIAAKLGIPVTLFQHGVASFDSPSSNVINEFTGSMPIVSDKFVVWGEAMKNYSLQFGIDENKINVLGSISHEKLFDIFPENVSSDYILLAPEPPGQINIRDYDVSVNQEYEDALKQICKTAVKKNKKLIIKLKPHILELNEIQIAHSVDPSIQVLKTGDMSNLVKNCSVFITFGITSAMLDASYYQKPIIRIRMREWWDSPDSMRPPSGISVFIDDFEKTLNRLFSDDDFLHQELKNRKIFLNNCLSNQNSVSQQIKSFLMS